MFGFLSLPFLLMTGSVAEAGYRIGTCVGVDTSCQLLGINAQFFKPKADLKLSLGVLGAGAQLHRYLRGEEKRFRPYVHGGGSHQTFPIDGGFDSAFTVGAGLGFDLGLGSAKKWFFGMQAGAQYYLDFHPNRGGPSVAPGLSLNLNRRFGD